MTKHHPDAYQFAPFNQLIKGIGLNLLAWFAFTIMTTLIRILQKDISLMVILFFQNLTGVICTLPFILKNHHSFEKTPWKLLVLRTFFGQLNMFLLFFALKTADLTEAMLLGNSAPIFIPILGLIWLGNKIKSVIWPGIILGFIGIFLILRPNSLNIGEVYALGAGVCLGMILLTVRLLSLIERTGTILFYLFLGGLLVFAPLAFFFWTPLTLKLFGLLMTVSFLLLIGQFLLVKSFTFGESSQLSPFSYSVVLYATFFDWYLWGRIPDFISVVGMILVCIGGIITIFLTKPKQA